MKDNYIAIAKALGIMLMVMGHSGCPDFLYRFIYMFHMPLFFFCSGFFMKPAGNIIDLRSFIIKRFKGLYLPYVKWSLFFLLFHNLFLSLHLYNLDYIGKYDEGIFIDKLLHIIFTMTGHDQLADPYWFFKQLLLSSVMVSSVEYTIRHVKYRLKNVVTLIFFLALTTISKFYGWGLPVIWNLSIVFLSTSFFFLGYVYRRNEIKPIKSYAGFIAMLIVIIEVYIYNDYLDMLWYTWKNVVLYVVIAVIGVFMVLAFSQLLERTRFANVLYYIGNHTMIIFVLHLLVFKLVNLLKVVLYQLPIERLADFKIVQENNELFWLVYFVCGVSLPLALEWVVTKVRCRLIP